LHYRKSDIKARDFIVYASFFSHHVAQSEVFGSELHLFSLGSTDFNRNEFFFIVLLFLFILFF